MAFIYDSMASGPNDQGRASAYVDSQGPLVEVRPLPLEVAGAPDIPQGDGDLRRMAPQTRTQRENIAGKPPAATATERLRIPVAAERSAATVPTAEQPAGMRRAASALRVALPYVQRILPLLVEGNIAASVTNLLAQTLHPSPSSASITAMREGLSRLEAQHRELRGRVQEQSSAMKRIEDGLASIREASERNNREQKEMLDELKRSDSKMKAIALLAFALLTISVLTNVALYIHMQRIFP